MLLFSTAHEWPPQSQRLLAKNIILHLQGKWADTKVLELYSHRVQRPGIYLKVLFRSVMESKINIKWAFLI